MALIKCRNCGAEISDRAPDCIHCGALITKETASRQASLPLAEKKSLEKELAFQQNLSKLEQEKRDLESENLRYKTAATTAENQLVSEQNAKAKLVTEKETLVQCNQDLQQTISSIEKERQVLASENARYKTAVTEVSNRLSNEQSQKARLEAENDSLQQHNLELEKQLKASVKKAKALEDEKIRAKKVKEAKIKSKKAALKIGVFLRLLLVGFLAFAAIVSLFSGKFGLALWYGALAATIAPYVYHFLWAKVEVSKALKIAIEILVPVVILFL